MNSLLLILLYSVAVLALPMKGDVELDWEILDDHSDWEFVKRESDLRHVDEETSQLPILSKIRHFIKLDAEGPNTPVDGQVARKTLDDVKYLESFRYYNARDRTDTVLVQKLAFEVPGVDKTALYRAVEEARETERVSFDYASPSDILKESLKPVLQGAIKKPEALVGTVERLASSYHNLDIQSNNLPTALSDYNDDMEMDNLVASILAQGDRADPEAFRSAVGVTYRRIAAEKSILPRQLNVDNFEEHLSGILIPEFIETLKYREILQVARRKIKQEKSDLRTQESELLYDDDTRMAELLIPLLPKKDFDIPNIITRARETVTLQVAVQQSKLFAVRKLVVFGIGYPEKVIQHLVQQTVYRKDLSILAILLPHTSLDFLASVLFNAVKTAIQNQVNSLEVVKRIRWAADKSVISTILTDPRAIRPTINTAYEYGSIGDGKILSIFWESGRVKKV